MRVILLVHCNRYFSILFCMSEQAKCAQHLFTDRLTTKEAFDAAKLSGKIWFLDGAPKALVDDIEREFFRHKSEPVDLGQGNDLREQVVGTRDSSNGIFNKRIVELL